MIILRDKLYSTKLQKAVYGIKKVGAKLKPKASRPSDYQVKRSSLQTAASIKDSLNSAALNPGGALSKGVETTIRKPFTVAGTVSPIPGGGIVGAGVDTGITKVAPGYAKGLNKAANAYKAKVGPYVTSAGNAFVNNLRAFC